MKLVHIGDTHLGFRAYNRITQFGVNTREADVFNSFRQTLAKTAEINPDIVIIAGDMFHTVRPDNVTIYATFNALNDFRGKCAAPVVIIGGNHDTPKTSDAGCILDLYRVIPNIHVVHSENKSLDFGDMDLRVFCMPFRTIKDAGTADFAPVSKRKYNVFTLHGTVGDMKRGMHDTVKVDPEILKEFEWDYIALGHIHISEQVGERAWYSGSTDYASTNVWEEAAYPKGFIEYDLDEHKMTFHKIETRRVIDLPVIDAAKLTAEEVMEAVRTNAESFDCKDAIVRQVVENISRSVDGSLDRTFIKTLRGITLDFTFTLRKPEESTRKSESAGAAVSLEKEWADFCDDITDLPADIDKETFKKMGAEYLEAVK